MPLIDERFAAALIDGGVEHTICGVRLLPYCLWHLFQLQVLDSPFLRKGFVTHKDLKTALGVCRLSYPDSNIKTPYRPILCTQRGIEKHVNRMLAYFGDYLTRPEWAVIPLSSFGKPMRRGTHPPETIQIAYDASEGDNIPIEKAWMLPIGRAYLAQAMAQQRRGANLDFISAKEIEEQRLLDEGGFNWRNRN